MFEIENCSTLFARFVTDEMMLPDRSNRSSASDTKVPFGYFKKHGIKTETFLQEGFTFWGTFCARQPGLVLALGN